MKTLQGEMIWKLAMPCQKVLLIGVGAHELAKDLATPGDSRFTAVEPAQLYRVESGHWDLIVLLGTLDETHDVISILHTISTLCSRNTRVAVASFSKIRRGYTKRRYGSKDTEFNWLPRREVTNLLELTNFEVIKQFPEVLVPYNLGILSRGINRWLAPLPFFRQFVVVIVTIARLGPKSFLAIGGSANQSHNRPSLSIIIPTRNEAGNIDRILNEIPRMAADQELIFVEGNSTDDTWETLQDKLSSLTIEYPYRTQLHKQSGKGKGDAVRLGFNQASGDILMILDADLTVPASELPMFYEALTQHKTEFANGSRLVYPQEKEAMRFLNYVANKLFGLWFTFVIGQPIRDTLCGTKVLWREDYRKIATNRDYFGELDPFGDFDLLFGAARLNLKIRDIPVHYKERTYGSTNISRFRHGWLLLKMSVLAARKLVFAPRNS